MRVIAGSAKRLQLESPETGVRPTTDRLKETLFNMIQNEVYGALVLDLFAGSGALGIECISRGAGRCIFVDNSNSSVDCIKKNLKHTKLIEKADVLKYDYVKACESFRGEMSFDIIFLDPPYNNKLEQNALNLIDQYQLLNEDGMIVVESSIDTVIETSEWNTLQIFKEKTYRTNKFTFVERKVD